MAVNSSQPLFVIKTATSDSTGAATFVFDTVPSGLVWTGSFVIVRAPASSESVVSRGSSGAGIEMGSWFGPGPFGPLQGRGLEVFTVTATGLTASTQYQCNFVGVSIDASEADLAENAPFTLPFLGSTAAGSSSSTLNIFKFLVDSDTPTNPFTINQLAVSMGFGTDVLAFLTSLMSDVALVLAGTASGSGSSSIARFSTDSGSASAA